LSTSRTFNVKPQRSANDHTQERENTERRRHDIRDIHTGDDLAWINAFIEKVKPYIYVREKDSLLILVPNQVYKLNQTGVALLRFLLKGHTIQEFLRAVGDTAGKQREIHYFFCDLRAAVSGCLRESEKREAVAYYQYDGTLNEYPVLSELAVTYRCNLRCNFCYVGEQPCDELSTSDAQNVLYKIAREAEVPSVSFTGGEPMLRTDIRELVAYASGIGMWTNLITNGTLLTVDAVRQLRDAGLSSAQVSIEGPNAVVHDSITGVPGSFEKTLNGIAQLKAAGIPVHTNTTVSKANSMHLLEIVPLVRRLGLKRLSMNLLIPCGTAQNRKELWISYSEIGEHIITLRKRAEAEGIAFLWYSPVPMCLFNPIAHGFGNKSCAAITGLLSIDPQGNVIPCSSWRMPVGSLLKERFKDIWQSTMLMYFKNSEYAPDTCHACFDFDACKGACPLYWNACGLKELHGRP
jgi:radical SAM protein with 4Fe4S-binding SPASM domain